MSFRLIAVVFASSFEYSSFVYFLFERKAKKKDKYPVATIKMTGIADLLKMRLTAKSREEKTSSGIWKRSAFSMVIFSLDFGVTINFAFLPSLPSNALLKEVVSLEP